MAKTYKVKLSVTYDVYVLANADDVDMAVDVVEKQLKKMDDYEVVNRATNKGVEIEEIVEVFTKPEFKHGKSKKKNK